MGDRTGSKFSYGDVVIDKERNIGMVKSITAYPKINGTTGERTEGYQIVYGITGIWRKVAFEEELEIYAPAERD